MPIPVVRAEAFYTPPPQQPADAWVLVPAAERVWRWVEYQLQRRVTPPSGVLLGEQVWARINHGRWVADCVCESAQIVTPADARFACTECGWGWVTVVFPGDPAAAEAEVEAAPPHLRNWRNPEDPTSQQPPALPSLPEPGPVQPASKRR